MLTYMRKGLLRLGNTVLSYLILIVMEKTISTLMLATPRVLQSLKRKAEIVMAIRHRDTAHTNRAAVATTMLSFLSECCPPLLYLGHLVRERSWSKENSGTGARAHEVL